MQSTENICHDRFSEDGYLIVRDLLEADEVDIVREALTTDPAIKRFMFEPKDASGKGTGIVAWNQPGNSSYGLLSRSEPIVHTMRSFLDGEVYHYHSKLTAKAARTGGAWEWHQDYDYWRQFGCEEPLMASVMIAIDDADKHNGCLQVVRGSHRQGLPHKTSGTQRAADAAAVRAAITAGEHIYCELAAGDAVFFHCNTLHCSDANTSSRQRWSLLCCYNAARNSPTTPQIHSAYRKLETVSGQEVRRAGVRLADGVAEEFLDMQRHSIQ